MPRSCASPVTACRPGSPPHDTPVLWNRGDVGREAITKDPADRGRFRAPSLRDIALTAPYMHDGSVRTLEEVVAFYDRGANANPLLDHRIRPLSLTEGERADLIAFLESLTGRPN
ncbi:MAG: c-type cytochrome [Gemmatimonadetes bacterium]|nr:c-type cytochrome [Gemmatimonadota bacterium]